MGMSTGQRDCQGLLHGLGFRTIFESVILSRKVVLSKNTEMAVPGNAGVEKVRKRILNPFTMRAYMLAKLPLGLMAGLKVVRLDQEVAEVTVPYGWRSTNPFRSTYFAALSMAAEMSTGVLCMVVVEAASMPVSMMIIGMDAQFLKKATATTTFRCEQGDVLQAAVEETIRSGEPVVEKVQTVGRAPDGTEVARFTFTWSFKRKSSSK